MDQLTEQVIGACFEVSNELGTGFLESGYEKALLVALTEKGITTDSQKPINVYFRGREVGLFFVDILIENKLIVELKAIRQLTPEHLAQTINYLKATGLETALLVNFGNKKVEYRRLYNKVGKVISQG